jgi:hypothetical protein
MKIISTGRDGVSRYVRQILFRGDHEIRSVECDMIAGDRGFGHLELGGYWHDSLAGIGECELHFSLSFESRELPETSIDDIRRLIT